MNKRLGALIAVVLLVSSVTGRGATSYNPGPCQLSLKACPPPAPAPCGVGGRMPCPQPKK